MAPLSIKIFFVQGVYAACIGDKKGCLDSQHSGLALAQRRAIQVPARDFLDIHCYAGLPRLDDLYWMHTPKTGTSFKFTIQEVSTHDRYRLGGFHEPLPKDASDKLLSRFTTMLRDPAQRLASAIAYTRTCTLPQSGWRFQEHHGCGAADVLELVKKGKTPADDECLSSLIGCQTNMLLGKGCMTGGSHNNSDIVLAKSRLDKFFFVGLVEEWELSICLFNFKLTGRRYVEQCQIRDSRPTDGQSFDPSAQGSHTYDVTGYPLDEADEEIYRHGKEQFQKEIAKHGITKEACAPTIDESLPE